MIPTTTSIIIPSIRVCNLEKVYDSIVNASKLNSFEVIVISPFLPPENLLKKPNFRFIHSYASPSVCAQIGFSFAVGTMLYNAVDDGVFQEGAIDNALNFIKQNNLRNIDILNMRYIEDVLNVDLSPKTSNPIPFPDSYWQTRTYPDFYLPGIDLNWSLAPHFFVNRDFFNWLGGLDCNFEYLNWNLHDFCFRAQAVNGKIYQSPFTAFLCSHLPGATGDHFAIYHANDSDKIRFKQTYSQLNIVDSRIRLPIDNWKNHPQVWSRRFPDINNLPLYK